MPDCGGFSSDKVAEAIGRDTEEIRFLPAAEGLGKCAFCANRTCALPTSYGAFNVKCSMALSFHRARERCTGFVLSVTSCQPMQLDKAA